METIRTPASAWKAGLPLVLLFLFLMTTDPQRLPSVLLILPFGLVFLAVVALVLGIIAAIRQEAGTVLGRPLRRPRLLAAIIAAFPTLLLVLQSIGQLSPWDIATATALLALAYICLRSTVSFFHQSQL